MRDERVDGLDVLFFDLGKVRAADNLLDDLCDPCEELTGFHGNLTAVNAKLSWIDEGGANEMEEEGCDDHLGGVDVFLFEGFVDRFHQE